MDEQEAVLDNKSIMVYVGFEGTSHPLSSTIRLRLGVIFQPDRNLDFPSDSQH